MIQQRVQTLRLIGSEENVGAIDPRMVICEQHTAGSVSEEEIPYMVI